MQSSLNATQQESSWKEYEAFTDVVLNKLLDEHKLFSSDLHKMQIDIIKNYLWLSGIVASAVGTVLATNDFKLSELSSADAIAMPSLMFSAFLACLSFIKGTRLLLGERGGLRPVITVSYHELLDKAYGDDESQNTFKAKQEWISELEGAVAFLRETHSEKGAKIRGLNGYLVASAAIGLAGATISFLADHL